MSDIDQVDLTTLLGTLRFYSRFRGEIPPSICAKAADRIEELEAALRETQLEARRTDAEQWIEIFPPQVEWMNKAGYQLRARAKGET